MTCSLWVNYHTFCFKGHGKAINRWNLKYKFIHFGLGFYYDARESGVMSEMRAHLAPAGSSGRVDFVRDTTWIFLLWSDLVDVTSMERSLVENVFLFGLNVAGWLWGIVSFLPWYYLDGRKQYRPKNKVQARPVSDFPGAPHRCVEHFDSLRTSLYDGVTTLDQMFK